MSASQFDVIFAEAPFESGLFAKEEERRENFESFTEQCRDGKKGTMLRAARQLAGLMTSMYVPELLEDYRETFADAMVTCQGRGNAEEAVRACHALAVALLSTPMQEISVGVFDDVFSKLSQAARVHANHRVRMAAFAALAVLASVGSSDDAQSLEVVAFLEARAAACRLSSEAPAKMEAEAIEAEGCLRAWMFIATQWSSEDLGRHYVGPVAALWGFALRCLMHDSLSLRLAAGEAIGLMMEAKWKSNTTVSLDKMEKRHPQELAELRTLTDTTARHIRTLSREDKKEQLQLFRAVADTVEKGTSPDFSFYLGTRERSLHLKSWTAVCRHDFLRALLKGGLAEHLRENETVRTLMGVGGVNTDDIEELHGAFHGDRAKKTKDRQSRRKDDRSRKTDRLADAPMGGPCGAVVCFVVFRRAFAFVLLACAEGANTSQRPNPAVPCRWI